MRSYPAWLSELKTAVYRRPRDYWRKLQRWGPRAVLRLPAWQRRMERAAEVLTPPTAGDRNAPPLEVWMLTGERFWYQSAFCAWTLARHSKRSIILHLIDDGTLTPLLEQKLRRLFPEGTTLCRVAALKQLQSQLPVDRYPTLHRRWHDYINIHKLTGAHLGGSGVKLVLDSDMLFFHRPDALLAWWDAAVADPCGEVGHSPCLMVDCEESYGYSPALMEELAGAPIVPLLNVGICGLSSSSIDWDLLEHWCTVLEAREGASYFLEQALVAMLAARVQPVVMPRRDYITFPTSAQSSSGEGVLQHYVADSKPWYFDVAWERASALAGVMA